MHISLFDIATRVHGTVLGDAQVMIHTLSPLDDVTPDSLVFADDAANFARAEDSCARAILTRSSWNSSHKPVIHVEQPFQAFVQLLDYFYPTATPTPGIHASACIAPDVVLGQQVSIGPFVVIESGCVIGDHCVIKSHVSVGHDVVIGAHCVLHPHVVIYDRSQLGCGVVIHASSVIGSDGFGYRFEAGEHQKVPHVGHVVIHDQVEIGANTVVDRATLGTTVIGEGTKIDNLVQIAHSVKLGKHNILCAFTGIAGSTSSGDHVIFAANVGVSDHVRIDDGVILGARAGVPPRKHLKQGNIYLGNPARPKEKALEQELSSTRLPFMRKHLKSLADEVKQLTERLNQVEVALHD